MKEEMLWVDGFTKLKIIFRNENSIKGERGQERILVYNIIEGKGSF
jgi:hypothetical protein